MYRRLDGSGSRSPVAPTETKGVSFLIDITANVYQWPLVGRTVVSV